MSEGEFCVVCGATGRSLVDGVCAPCAAGRTVLVRARRHARVTICPHCGAREVGGHWERSGASRLLSAEDLSPFLEVHPEAGVRRMRWEETAATSNQRELVGQAHVVFRGIERDVDVPLTVQVVGRSCPDCSRKSGRYYTAILQLRGATGDRSEKPRGLRERLAETWGDLLKESRPEWRRAVSWQEERPEGWDVYLTETVPARAMARLAKQRFGATVKESASLFGRKDGHDVYRVTFSLRFPRADPEGRPVRPAAALEQ